MKSKKLKQAYDALVSGIPVLMCTPQEARMFKLDHVPLNEPVFNY